MFLDLHLQTLQYLFVLRPLAKCQLLFKVSIMNTSVST